MPRERDPSSPPPTAGEAGQWDRSLAVFDRWTPPVLLGVSTVMSAISPGHQLGTRLGTLALAGVAAVWMLVGYSGAPRSRRERPAFAPIYLTGVLILAGALMSRDVIFFIFAIAGFLHAAALRPAPLVFVGIAATSFLINVFTWGGLPTDVGAIVAFVSVLVIQTFLIGFGLIGSEKLTELSESRRRTVQQLEVTLAENEGLHAQLVAQAREAGVNEERRRMAREIHDTLAQGLTGVITQLEAADQGMDDPHRVRRHLDNAAELARTSLSEARRSVQALAPGALAHGRLEDALDGLVRDWSSLSGVTATATVTGAAGPRSTEVEVALLRVAQEALANVAKHADATRVGVTLSQLDDQVVLDVRDDGRGFDVATVDGAVSFGLTAMRQRVAHLGGTLTVESRPGAGTAISATVPSVPAGPEDPSGSPDLHRTSEVAGAEPTDG